MVKDGRLAGTFQGCDGPSQIAELYDPNTGTFSITGGLISGREGHTATLLSDGTVLIAGGHGFVPVPGGGYDNLASTEIYDPVSGTFRPSGSMATGRESPLATLLTSGRVLVTGGAEYYPCCAGNRPAVYAILSTAELYTPPDARLPYGGTPVALPGVIEAANFDDGGERIAYNDTTSGNAGGAYRPTDVDIAASTEGGYTVGWIDAGEWLRYTVNVITGGDYLVELRVASPSGGGSLHVVFDQSGVSAPVTMPTTGGWQTWTTVTVPVTLQAGPQFLRLLFDTPGFNVSWISVVTPPAPNVLTPYGGSARALPGTVQAADFDNGGEDVAYHDTTSGNTGGAYRQTDVDLAGSSEGGLTIGWIDAGEWVNYTVNVTASGTYSVQLRVASPMGGGLLHVGFNDSGVWTELTVPATGDWQRWTTISFPAALQQGQQQVTLYFDTAGYNISWFSVEQR